MSHTLTHISLQLLEIIEREYTDRQSRCVCVWTRVRECVLRLHQTHTHTKLLLLSPQQTGSSDRLTGEEGRKGSREGGEGGMRNHAVKRSQRRRRETDGQTGRQVDEGLTGESEHHLPHYTMRDTAI